MSSGKAGEIHSWRACGRRREAVSPEEVRAVPFDMETEHIESRVVHTLSQRPGHVAHFNKYQIELLSRAIAAAIVENNARIQNSLGNVRINLGEGSL